MATRRLEMPAGWLGERSRLKRRHWLARDLIFASNGHVGLVYGAPMPPAVDALRSIDMLGTGWPAHRAARGWKPDGTNYAYWDVPENIALPVSISGWWYGTASTSTDSLVALRRPTSNNGGLVLSRSSGELARVAALSTAGSTAGANSAATFTSNGWMHGLAVFESSASRIIYGNGGNPASNATSLDSGTDLRRIGIAVGVAATPTAATTAIGGIALPMLIARVLAADEAARLYAEQLENPWSVFEAEHIWVPVSAGGASAPVGRADETDAAIALAAIQIAGVGLAAEVDTALALSAGASAPVGLAQEIDTALALSPRQSIAVGLAVEADTALSRPALQVRTIGRADEADAALALSPSTPGAVGLATEADTALALVGLQLRAAGTAIEVDLAIALTPAGETEEAPTVIVRLQAERRITALPHEARITRLPAEPRITRISP